MRATYKTCLVTATALSGALWSNAAWADCVSQAPVHPEQVVCDAPGTLGWDGSGTDNIVVTVNSSASVLTSPGGPALISTGTGSAVINFAGTFSGGVPTYGIDAGSPSNMAISVGGNSVVTNSSGAAINGSIEFGNATGTGLNVLNNNYSSTGGTNHIGLIDGNVDAQGNFTLDNAGLMGWYTNVTVTQTGSGAVNISNGIDGGYITGFVGAYPYQNGFIWGGGTVISTEGSTNLVNHGGGNGMGGLIHGDVILGQLGEGTSTLINGSTVYGNATIMGNVTMADHNNTITNDGTISGDVLMDGTGTNIYNAGSAGSTGDNGYRMAGVPLDGNGLATGVGTGTLTGHSGADNILNLNGVDSSTLLANVINFYTINKNDSGYWTIGAQLAADDNQTININDGALLVDDADYLDTSVLTTIHNNSYDAFGSLLFLGNGAGTFSGNIDGTGSVGVTGANPTTWTGTNTYTGWTWVYNGGTLNADSTGALSAASDMYVSAATLNVNADSTVNNLYDYVYYAGTSTVNINGANSLSVAGGYFGNNGGQILGTGRLVKYSAGTLDLYGSNLIAPDGIVVDDGIVNDHDGSIGDSSAVSINSTSTTAGTLNVLSSDTIGSLSGTGADAVVDIASGATLTTGGLNTSTGFAGHITGDGALVKTGTGAMTLTGTNTYAGGTTINGGSIIGYAGTNATNGSLQGDIDVALGASVEFDQTLSPLGNTSGTYAGQLSGQGFVTFLGNGTGILTLTGDNSGMSGAMNFYNNSIVSISAANNLSTGSLNFSNGTLMTTADMTVGNGIYLDTGGGTINAAGGTTLTSNGGTSGSGSLTKSGTGTLILNGYTGHTGGTTVSAGVLQGDAGVGINGDIVNNAQVNVSGYMDTYNGDMSGTGDVVVFGNALIAFSGDNSYSGTTTIEAGSDLIGYGTTTALSSNSTFVVDGILEAWDQTLTLGGLSGTGLLNTNGQTVNIGANNSSTTFSGVIGNGGWGQTNGCNCGSANINKIGTGTLTLSGTGSVLTGNLGVQAGTLSLTGDLTAATTTVDSGAILSVDGALTSPTVLINAGGRLVGGVGTTAGVITGDVTNDGTVAPGHSPGIISIVGSYTQGSTGAYVADVGGNGTSTVVAGVDFDQISVSGTTGAASLDGTLQVVQNGGLYVAGTTYDVITTTGGITGNFASISGNVISPFITLSNAAANGGGVVGNNYRLVVVRSAYNTVALNPNQIAVADGLQALVGASGTSATVIKIDNMTASQAQALFNTTSPEPYGAYATALQDQGEMFTRQVDGRMAATGEDTTTGLWVNGYGQWGNGKNRDYRYGSDQRIIGIAGGVDFGLSGLRVGLGVGYSEDKLTYLQGNSTGKSKSWQVGGYAAYASGPLHVDGQVAYISGDITATKSINAGAGATLITGTAGVDTKGHLFKGILTLGYDVGTDSLKLRPYVGVDFSSGHINGFTETGMGVLNLTVADIKADRTDIVAGFRFSMPAGTITPYLNAAYRYRVNDSDRTVTAFFDSLSGSPFTVTGLNSGRSRFDVDAGLSAKIGTGASVFVGYQGTFRNDVDSHGVNGGISFSF